MTHIIMTDSGKRIRVDGTPDPDTLEMLKHGKVYAFHEFHYTGNSPNGHNSGNYEVLESFFRDAGFDIQDDMDDISLLMNNLEQIVGITHIDHRGKRLWYHVQPREGDSNSFGYTVRTEYRIIRTEDIQP